MFVTKYMYVSMFVVNHLSICRSSTLLEAVADSTVWIIPVA